MKKEKNNSQKTKEQLVGGVTHYFPKVKVAVVKLLKPLVEGDNIRIVGGEGTDFIQEVKSMEIDHQKIEKAKKGESIGLKIGKKVREGYKVYKI